MAELIGTNFDSICSREIFHLRSLTTDTNTAICTDNVVLKVSTFISYAKSTDMPKILVMTHSLYYRHSLIEKTNKCLSIFSVISYTLNKSHKETLITTTCHSQSVYTHLYYLWSGQQASFLIGLPYMCKYNLSQKNINMQQ